MNKTDSITHDTIGALIQLGVASVAQIANHCGLSERKVGGVLGYSLKKNRYGVKIVGKESLPTGGRIKYWTIDEAAYIEYLKTRRFNPIKNPTLTAHASLKKEKKKPAIKPMTTTALVVKMLHKYGPMATAELAVKCGLSSDKTSRTLDDCYAGKKYGVVVTESRFNSRNTKINIWAIDTTKYYEYIASRRFGVTDDPLNVTNEPAKIPVKPPKPVISRYKYSSVWIGGNPFERNDT